MVQNIPFDASSGSHKVCLILKGEKIDPIDYDNCTWGGLSEMEGEGGKSNLGGSFT